LDAKYSEIVYNGKNFKQNSSFTDFVFDWLGKYTIDEDSRKVEKWQHYDEPTNDQNRLW
jgi:hypothetical protein